MDAIDITKLPTGYPMDSDRRWILHTPDGPMEIAEYNDELTGFDKRLREMFPDVFHYGGNAYYITGRFAQEKGWRVEEKERPRG